MLSVRCAEIDAVPEFLQLADKWTVVGPIGDAPGMSDVIEVVRDGVSAVVKVVQKVPGGNRDLLATELGDCRNILPFDEIFDAGSELRLRMPKAEESLNHKLTVGGPFSEVDTVSVLTDIATALLDMGNVVVHRDIKPQNILRYNGSWCLADFGIARYTQEATSQWTFKTWASSEWTAPERWLGQRATIKSDIYSLGIVAYQLVTGELPFTGPDFHEQHRDSPPPTPGGASPLLRSLMLSMLAKSPAARPNPSQVLDRLAGLGRTVSSPAVNRLRELIGEQSEAQAKADAAAAEERTRRDQREELAKSANHLAREFFDPIAEELGALPGIKKTDRSRTVQFEFRSARLTMTLPEAVDPVDLPFDVVCAGSISVEMTEIRDRWAGRSHSLWYCDAQTEGEYLWFETGFHHLRNTMRLEPYSRAPRENDAQIAVSRVMHLEQVAVPFTPLIGDATGSFVERWIARFAQAAEGTLPRPGVLPEGGTTGTWRN